MEVTRTCLSNKVDNTTNSTMWSNATKIACAHTMRFGIGFRVSQKKKDPGTSAYYFYFDSTGC